MLFLPGYRNAKAIALGIDRVTYRGYHRNTDRLVTIVTYRSLCRDPQKIDCLDREYLKNRMLDRITDAETLESSRLLTLVRDSQTISAEISFDRLLEKILTIILDNSTAQKGYLILANNEKLEIVAGALERGKKVVKINYIPVEKTKLLPKKAIEYVAKTQASVILNNASHRFLFDREFYYPNRQIKSALCVPLVRQNKLIGVIYLENNLIFNAFTFHRIKIINLLCHQAAISIENAKLYREAQQSKALERAAKQMSKALEQEKKLNELKSRFISITSHEFRTPLATIMSSAELLKRYSHQWTQEKQQVHYERIINSVRHTIDLLEDALLFGKIDSGKMDFNPVRIDVVEFCQNLIQEINLGIEKNKHKIIFSANYRNFLAVLDRKLLEHILNNLLANAIKYSPNGNLIEFQLDCSSETITFKIKDRGIGIPVEDREHLFEFFHRAQNVRQIPGTGLGLAIVKRMVSLHGGTISVDSELDLGSTFTVSIPSV
jgi:signal transduction histidine kinase